MVRWCQMSAVPLDPSVCRVEGRAMAEPSAKKARSEFFPSISKIQFEGPQSINPLAFKYYQPDEVIMGKKMRCAHAVHAAQFNVPRLFLPCMKAITLFKDYKDTIATTWAILIPFYWLPVQFVSVFKVTFLKVWPQHDGKTISRCLKVEQITISRSSLGVSCFLCFLEKWAPKTIAPHSTDCHYRTQDLVEILSCTWCHSSLSHHESWHLNYLIVWCVHVGVLHTLHVVHMPGIGADLRWAGGILSTARWAQTHSAMSKPIWDPGMWTGRWTLSSPGWMWPSSSSQSILKL